MKVNATFVIELEVDGFSQVDDATDYVHELAFDLRNSFPTPPAGVTVERVNHPILDWE